MPHKIISAGVAQQIGTYSDAIEAAPGLRWLFTAGTPGLGLDGVLPKDITAQAEQAWKHILTMLEKAGMRVQDLVKVTHYLTDAKDIPAYVKVRAKYLGEARPASMLIVLTPGGLVRPEFLLEIEAIAAKAS